MKFIKNNFEWLALLMLLLIFFGVNWSTVKGKVENKTSGSGTIPANNPGTVTA